MTKKMLIIGGSGGIGREMTELFKDRYQVFSYGSRDFDITNFRFLERHFHVNDYDIVLNASGLNYDSFLHKYDEESMYDINKVIDVNVKGNINLLANCLPMMRKNNYGRIILISSVLSSMAVPGTGVYSATKAFADSLVKTVTVENSSKGITCNSIQLGYFDAGMAHRIPEKILNKVVNSIPLKRLGTMQELFQTLEFLINTEYVSGTSIKVNGGLHL